MYRMYTIYIYIYRLYQAIYSCIQIIHHSFHYMYVYRVLAEYQCIYIYTLSKLIGFFAVYQSYTPGHICPAPEKNNQPWPPQIQGGLMARKGALGIETLVANEGFQGHTPMNGCFILEKSGNPQQTRWNPRTRMLTRMFMLQMSKHMVMQSRRTLSCNCLFEQSCTCFTCYQSAVWSGKCRVWSVEWKV